MTFLRVERLAKEFGGVHAVENLSFGIQPGVVHSIIGPNGAGKTTLLNMLTGIYRPSEGRIFFQEQDLTGLAPYEFAGCGIARPEALRVARAAGCDSRRPSARARSGC